MLDILEFSIRAYKGVSVLYTWQLLCDVLPTETITLIDKTNHSVTCNIYNSCIGKGILLLG